MQWIAARSELKDLLKFEDKVLHLQSGSTWFRKGERPNKYFLSKFKERKKQQNITFSNIDEEQIINNYQIKNKIENFYSKLYSSENNFNKFYNEIDGFKLDLPSGLETHQMDSVFSLIKPSEIFKTVRSLPNNKSPGPDGIPFEFYKSNTRALITILIPLFNTMICTQTTPDESNNAIIITVYKKGNPSELKNWQPITLSNTDLKIFTKIIATRVGNLAKNIINYTQYGFVKESSIFENITKVVNVTTSIDKNGTLAFLDQEKAYDRVDWNYLTFVLKKIGFPETFLNWLINYFQGTSFKINTYFGLTNSIFPSRGLRQGDPLSPILYNFSLEPLLLTLNKELHGIITNNQEPLKALAFADDCVVGIKDETDSKKLEKIIKIYENYSQALLNKSKTEAIQLGKETFNLPWNISTTKNPVRHLGYLFTKDGPACDLMETNLLENCKKRLSLLTNNNLSLVGKTVIFNTFISSKIWFFAHLIPLSNIFIKNLKTITQQFLWQTEFPPRALDYLFPDKKKGGLGIVCIEKKADKIFGETMKMVLSQKNNTPYCYQKGYRGVLEQHLNLNHNGKFISLEKYLLAHKFGNGPQDLHPYFKRVFRAFKRSKWFVKKKLILK